MRKENLFKNKVTKSLVAALAFAMATAVVPVSADAATATKSITIVKGDTKKLAANLTKATTNKKKVATVTKKGKVTAVKKGTAKITATKNGKKKVTYKVTVKKAPTISATSVSVQAGSSKKVTVTKRTYLTVTYTSNKTNVATVNKNGKITGVKAGTAKITAKVKGYNKTFTFKVAVTVTAADVAEPSTPVDPGTTEPDTPVVTDQVITEATTLPDGTYNTVTITSNVAAQGTVSLGTAKISKLYIESGSEYNVDASQAEIGEIEVVEAGATGKAVQRVSKSPRINFGNNSKLSDTKLTVKGNVYLAGTAKVASINVAAAVSVYVEIPVAIVTIEGNSAAVSLNGVVDELAVKGASVSVSVASQVQKVSIEGEKTVMSVKTSAMIGEMTIASTGAQIVGNGAITTLAVNANDAIIKTAVVTATVGTGVTGTTIGGQSVAAGATVTNVTAVAGQVDTDAVNLVTDDETPSTNPSTPSTPTTTSTYSDKATATVGRGTKTLTAIVGAQTIVVSKDEVLGYVRGEQDTMNISVNGVNQTITPGLTVKPTTTGELNASFTTTFNGYKYTVTATGSDLDTVTVTVEVTYTASSRLGLTLTADAERKEAQLTLSNSDEKAVLTVGSDTLTINKSAIADFRETGVLKATQVVGGVSSEVELTSNNVSQDATDIAANSFIGSHILNGNRVDLYVASYTVEGSTKTADVRAVAYVPANVNVTLTK